MSRLHPFHFVSFLSWITNGNKLFGFVLVSETATFWRKIETVSIFSVSSLTLPLVPAPVWEISVGAKTAVWTEHGCIVLRTSGELLLRGFNVFDKDSGLDSFVRRQSSRLVKFYTLESQTNKCVLISEPGYRWSVLKNDPWTFLKHAHLCSRAV
jgi:hypothetical protein